MALVELIATPTTEPEVLDQLEAFVTTALGKGVVRAKDTPNFIANRVGIAGMLATMKEAENFGLGYDVVDDLTGKKLGRASSGTFRTADVVGLDTMAHVIKTLQDNLKDDPFYASYATPAVLQKLIDERRARPEDRRGLLQEGRQGHPALDPDKGDYVAGGGKADEIVARMLKKPPAERLKLLRESKNPQAQFLWAILRDSFHYAAVHLADVADSARDVDFAMRWGFGTSAGPVRALAAGRLEAGGAVGQGRHRRRQGAVEGAAAGLGVRRPRRRRRRRAYAPKARAAPRQRASIRRSTLPVYERQPFRESVFGAERAGAAEGRHRGVQERRGPRLDARRRGADRQHHRQAAPDQPGA